MTMRRNQMLATATILVALGAALAAAAAPRQGPCAEITAACQQAGFVQGGGKAGNGLMADCVVPIMQGTFQRPKAGKPLPRVSSQLVAACKEENPRFGQRNAPPLPAAEPPASPPPPAAPPAPAQSAP